MPRYRYWCAVCDEDTEVWCPMGERAAAVRCRVCGGSAAAAPPTRVHVNCNRMDFVTADITGEPVRIETKRQHDELCARHGVERLCSDELPSRPGSKRRKRTVAELIGGAESIREDMARVGQETGLNDKRGVGGKRRRKRTFSEIG